MTIGQVFKDHGKSGAGRIVTIGTALNVVLALIYGIKAWHLFPGAGHEEAALITLMCLAMPFALVGTWVRQGRRMGFQPNTLLNDLLVLIAAVPFLFSTLLV